MFAPIPVPSGHSLPWHTHGDRVRSAHPSRSSGNVAWTGYPPRPVSRLPAYSLSYKANRPDHICQAGVNNLRFRESEIKYLQQKSAFWFFSFALSCEYLSCFLPCAIQLQSRQSAICFQKADSWYPPFFRPGE
jgi:hypothetical protein